MSRRVDQAQVRADTAALVADINVTRNIAAYVALVHALETIATDRTVRNPRQYAADKLHELAGRTPNGNAS